MFELAKPLENISDILLEFQKAKKQMTAKPIADYFARIWGATLMHVMLLLRLCCVVYFIQIKEKSLLNPFYSSLFIFFILFLSITIYNILTTKCQN